MDDDAEHTRSLPVPSAQDGRTSRWRVLAGEPERPAPPACRVLLVPVTDGPYDSLVLRTGRLPSGEATGLAFTSEDSLAKALGPGQRWTFLSEPALKALLSPLGVGQIRVDPFVAPATHAPAA